MAIGRGSGNMHLGVVPKVRHLRNQTWAGYIRSLLSGLGSNGRLPTASSTFWPFQKNRKIAKLGREIEVAGGSEVAQVFYGWGTRSLLSGLGSNGARDERGFSGALVRR